MFLCIILSAIVALLTILTIFRGRARWLKSEWGYPDRTLTCSHCHYEYDKPKSKQRPPSYCPNCGFKMAFRS